MSVSLRQKGKPVIFPGDSGPAVFLSGAATRTTPEAAASRDYDVVIVGGGIAGSILAEQLSHQGHDVLILEAGPGKDVELNEYETYLSRFYGAILKDNQSPYAVNKYARMPRSTDAMPVNPGTKDGKYYLVETGKYCTDTTYTRVLGGTTMHWEAKALRMLPEDFDMRTRYGRGRNWPVGYDDLEPYYRLAERELGVSAEVEDQAYLGMHFPPGYVFPMHGIPLSYLDQVVATGVNGMEVTLGGERYGLKVRGFPQARNGVPNAAYDGGKGLTPVGAVSTRRPSRKACSPCRATRPARSSSSPSSISSVTGREQDPAKACPLEYAKRARDYLHEVLRWEEEPQPRGL